MPVNGPAADMTVWITCPQATTADLRDSRFLDYLAAVISLTGPK
jgi:hypothetical protein